jgi:hypothetical protein
MHWPPVDEEHHPQKSLAVHAPQEVRLAQNWAQVKAETRSGVVSAGESWESGTLTKPRDALACCQVANAKAVMPDVEATGALKSMANPVLGIGPRTMPCRRASKEQATWGVSAREHASAAQARR